MFSGMGGIINVGNNFNKLSLKDLNSLYRLLTTIFVVGDDNSIV